VIGPVLAAGPIAAALTGAGIGAAAGGLIGALTESGVPEEDARYYAEGVRRGDVLVTVKTDDVHAERAAEILDHDGAVDIDQRVTGWRSRGWTGYDETAQPYDEEQLRRERSLMNSSTTVGTAGMASSLGAPTRGNTGVNTTDDIRKAHDRRYADSEGTGERADSLASTNYGAGTGALGDMGNAIESRMDRGSDAVERGARKTGRKLERGMERIGDKVEEGWDKMRGRDHESEEAREVNEEMRRRRVRVYPAP
jgi:hypothetical protein